MNQNDICQERHRSNSESMAANPSSIIKQRDRMRVNEIIKRSRGITSKEIAEQMNRRLNCISGRISELKQAGLVMVKGRRDACGVLHSSDFELITVKGRRDACGILHPTHQNEQPEPTN